MSDYIHDLLESTLFPSLNYRSIPKDYLDPKYSKPEICEECGQCCKRCGCYFSPDDFTEISFDFLKKEIEKGYISIEYFEGNIINQNVGVYILRIRNQGAPIVDSGYKRTPCILLKEDGCKLDYEHRPSGGKLLIPSTRTVLFSKKLRDCLSDYTIKDCCFEWLPHKKILYKLSLYFKDKDFPCSL